MRRFLELIEQKENVIFTFGRFNPPTTGHEKLIQKVASTAGSSPFRIYPSYSQNQKKDPLPFALKIAYMRKMYPKYAKNIIADKDAKTAINIATKLHDEGFKNVTMVVGSDRVNEFSSLLKKYNGVEGKRHGFYKFDNINVVSAGERDPDAEGVTGMSASKMRQAASDSDFDSFSKGLPSGFKDGKKLYLDVRKHMGIREERDMGEMTDFESLRDMYLTGKIWNIGDLVEANGIEGKVIRKGTNYLAYNDSQGKVHKVWLHEITINEIQKGLRRVKQDPDIKGDKGTEPAKYYKGVARKTKPKRDDHFEKGAKMDDDNPAAYTPAPGDKDKSGKLKKTKPSKHTVKFKKMFGDDLDEMTGINVPELIKTTIHRLTHPKGYKDLIQKYIERVKQTSGKPTNGAILSDLGHQMGFDRIKPLQDYVNNLVKRGKLPQELTAEYEDQNMEEQVINEKIEGLVNKSKKSKVAYGILKKVYDRGMAAWKTGHRPGTTPQQWAFARVNSFLTGGGARKADADLWSKAKASKASKKEEFELDENGFVVGKVKMPKMKGGAKLKGKTNFDFRLFDPEDSPGSDKANDEMNREIVKASKMKDKEAAMAHMNKIQRKHSKHGATDTEPREVIAQVLNRVFGESVEIDEGIPKSTQYALVQDGKVVAKGSKRDMVSRRKKEGGTVFNSPSSKVGDKKGGRHGSVKEDIQTWYESIDTRMKYQLDHGDDWWWKMNEVHDKMLEKLGLDEGCSIDDADEIPKKRMTIKEFSLKNVWGEIDEAAEYDGRPVKLNNPTRGDRKKYKVYVKNDKGNVVKVEFGDPNMEIKRDDPGRRKSFRARHNCDNPGPKYKARYWSCKFWEKGKSVTDLMKG